MSDEIILKQPSDRRLTKDTNNLPPGPPGAENDDEHINDKNGEKSVKDSSKTRRRSPSGSPPSSKRKSPSKGPQRSPRGRRTPSPRRRFGRSRNDYSPDRRRFNDRGRMRRSPVRNRSRERMENHRNGRDRFRRRRNSRSRSNSPISRRRWSPKKKQNSPQMSAPVTQYNVAGPPMFSDAYSSYGQYGQTQQPYGHNDFVEAPPQTTFAPGYPPPPTWLEGYPQQNWVQQPEPIPQPIMQQPSVLPLQTTLVQPPGTQQIQPVLGVENKIEVNPTTDAVAQEAENQRDELKKQRTSYLKKTSALKKELKVLKDQRKELVGGSGSHSPTTKGFLDENERLQTQIQKKLSTIENVIDMLTGIIGEENLPKEDTFEATKKRSKKRHSSSSSSSDDSSSSNSSSSSSSSSSSDSEENSSSERLKNKAIESMKQKKDKAKAMPKDKSFKDEAKKSDEKKINYVFYDPETHWCKICNTFPKTAKDYLTHLHSKHHTENIEVMETPWHTTMTNDEYPTFDGAPIKRTPIRGLTFFVPATSWYCKICSFWMGDLHCASLHLKSKNHSNKYNAFLEKNPTFEFDWLAERQKKLEEKRTALPTAQTILSLDSTDQKEDKSKSKNGEDKVKFSKKRKKKNSEKKDKKKKKRSKKRKRTQVSSSSNGSSSETDAVNTTQQIGPTSIPGPAAPSIRVQMRNLEKEKEEIDVTVLAPPPPPKISEFAEPVLTEIDNSKKDDLISQWNTVNSVISDSEKKLFEQLKGKLKMKPADAEKKEAKKVIAQPPVVQFIKTSEKNSTKQREGVSSLSKRDNDKKEKKKDNGGDITNRRRSRSRPTRRTRSRSVSATRLRRRSRSRGGGFRRSRSWVRSPSHGRHSPRGYDRRRRSRSKGRRRSRSHGRSRRRLSSSRSRSRSGSNVRIEKAIVRQPEFRPRVPAPDVNNSKKSKTKFTEEKEDLKKSTSKSSTSYKKLPFIGRMPVFKKQSQNSENPESFENNKKEEEGNQLELNQYGPKMGPEPAMGESYVHAGYEPSLMSEYDDLMPDPVQFVSLMGAPPPPPSRPPPQHTEDEKDILPPGIDETETEFVPKPISDAPIPRKGPLPKDFEEALNIIFPDEKKPDDSVMAKPLGETQIIIEEPVMQQSDLIKEGIHMMTVEETSLVGLDEASQMSMNEPLQFNKPALSAEVTAAQNSVNKSVDISSQSEFIENVTAACISSIPPPPLESEAEEKKAENDNIEEVTFHKKSPDGTRFLSPTKDIVANISNDRPLSPTDSEKHRRQEELDDLAMLGIDADDMAAMCI